MKKALQGWLLIAPLTLGCLVFYIIPFGMVFQRSVMQGAGAAARYVGLQNFRSVTANPLFRQAFGNTMRFLAVSLPLVMVLAYAIALMLKRQAGRLRLLKSVFLLPYIMPVVGTVLLVDLVFSGTGVWNGLLTALGLPVRDWLNGPAAFWVMVLLYLWKNTGYAVILLLAGLAAIPEELYGAAALDGAGPVQRFRYITTPHMRYAVFFALIFSLINAFKCFREIFLIGGRHPAREIYMLQHFLNNSFENLNYAKLSVASILLLAVILVLFTALYAFIRRKEG